MAKEGRRLSVMGHAEWNKADERASGSKRGRVLMQYYSSLAEPSGLLPLRAHCIHNQV